MNIFLLSYERNAHKHFVEQAKFHCDKHVIKMIAESTQLLVTALSVTSPLASSYQFPCMMPSQLPCKPLGAAHAKHPCAIWTAASINHVHYLVRLAIALCEEKKRRWPIKADHVYESWLHDLNQNLFSLGFEDYDPLPLDFAVAVKDVELRSTATAHHQTVAIYRSYYVADKAAIATWRKPAMTPIWYLMMLEELADSESTNNSNTANTTNTTN